MGTMNQFEEQLRPFKLALIEAFGLDPGKTSSSVSVGSDSVTFKCVGMTAEEIAGLDRRVTVYWDVTVPGLNKVEFPAGGWNEEQRQAAEAYRGQFPSFEDFPAEIRAALREQDGVQP